MLWSESLRCLWDVRDKSVKWFIVYLRWVYFFFCLAIVLDVNHLRHFAAWCNWAIFSAWVCGLIFFLNDRRLLVVENLSTVEIIYLNVSTRLFSSKETQIFGKVYETDSELWAYLTIVFFLIQLVQILLEVSLKLAHTFLHLLLLLNKNGRVSKVLWSHVANGVHKFHVLSELQGHQVWQGEQRLVVLFTHVWPSLLLDLFLG